MSDARGFRLELERFTTQTVPGAAADMQRRIVAEVLTGIVQRTPVGNADKWAGNVARKAKGLASLPKGYVGGQARRNWQVTIDAPAQTPIAGTDPGGEATLTAGYAAAAGIQKPSQVWISNPLEYMEPLENGWSRQAPEGMVARAIADIVAKYSRPVP